MTKKKRKKKKDLYDNERTFLKGEKISQVGVLNQCPLDVQFQALDHWAITHSWPSSFPQPANFSFTVTMTQPCYVIACKMHGYVGRLRYEVDEGEGTKKGQRKVHWCFAHMRNILSTFTRRYFCCFCYYNNTIKFKGKNKQTVSFILGHMTN